MITRFHTANHLEQNAARMVKRHGPGTPMPDDQSSRVLSHLQQHANQTTPGRTGPAAAHRPWIAAAAMAALIVVLLISRLVPSTSTLAWADVAEAVSRVTSVRYQVIPDSAGEGDVVAQQSALVMMRDPGLTRVEFGPPDLIPGAPDWRPTRVLIRHVEGSKLVSGSFDTVQRAGMVSIETGYAPPVFREHAAFAWRALERLVSSDVRRVGSDRLRGVPVVVFQAPLELVAPPGSPAPDGWIRVWADAETGQPVQLLTEYEVPERPGSLERQRIPRLEWNIELPDALFDLSTFSDYETTETRSTRTAFGSQRFVPDTQLRAPAVATDGLIFSERNVEAVLAMTVIETRPPDSNQEPDRVVHLALRVSPDAVERCRQHVWTFDGSGIPFTLSNARRTLRGVTAGWLEDGPTVFLELDTGDLSPAEFEAVFLTENDDQRGEITEPRGGSGGG